MEGSTRSRAHRDREPWTDPRTHDAERFLWGADTTARYSRELSSEAFGTDLAPRTASPPNSARSKHLELRGLTGTASHLGLTAPVRPDWKEQPERSRTPGFPPLLAHFPRGSDRARHSERGPRHANNGRAHAITSSSREPWADPRMHDDVERYLWGAAIIIYTTICSVLSTNRLWRVQRTRTRVTSPPQAT
jgi:hypothetical protein